MISAAMRGNNFPRNGEDIIPRNITNTVFTTVHEFSGVKNGGLLDNLFLYSVATGEEVRARLIKGHKYYN